MAHMAGVGWIKWAVLCEHFIGKLFSVVFWTVSEEGRFCVIHRCTIIVGHTVGNCEPREGRINGALYELDQVIIAKP